jgi:predicted regulator of amino acid metabolism with ACT domain
MSSTKTGTITLIIIKLVKPALTALFQAIKPLIEMCNVARAARLKVIRLTHVDVNVLEHTIEISVRDVNRLHLHVLNGS